MNTRIQPQLVLPMSLHAVPKPSVRAPQRIRRTTDAAPIGGLMDSRFVYVSAAETDIRKTFARLRSAQKGALRK